VRKRIGIEEEIREVEAGIEIGESAGEVDLEWNRLLLLN
jgi:hypothetical protein